MKTAIRLACLAVALSAAPAVAQGAPPAPEDTVFDDNWLSLGVGAVYGPSYRGSDDYTVFPLPVAQGKLAGIAIAPRRAGLAFDLIDNNNDDDNLDLIFGPVASVRFDRSSNIKDPVVKNLGKLDRAIELGGTAGIGFGKLLNPYDKFTATLDVQKDVADAHDGVTITPTLSYFTPLSKGIAAVLAVSAQHGDDKFNAYYYSVTPAGSLASGLPTYTAQSGWTTADANLFVGFDLDGELANGGVSLFALGGYGRMLGDARNSPVVRIRGARDQWTIGAGLGFTF
jgi:outer membrane scaffolding protein for murein synthesis (MipA/OmpV family)